MNDPLITRLRAAGCVFAKKEADEIRRLLSDPAEINAVVTARERGTPLEQALGRARFAGAEVELGAEVFVPRERATVLVDAAVAATTEPRTIVDLGCGSGAIAAALRQRFPRAEIHAVELDPVALDFARGNGSRLGFTVHAGDWWSALPDHLHGRIDLAVGYLPHVPSARLRDIPADYRDHEPDHTVNGGADGLDPLRAVLTGWDWLSADGTFITLVAAEQVDVARREIGDRPLRIERSADDRILTIGQGGRPV